MSVAALECVRAPATRLPEGVCAPVAGVTGLGVHAARLNGPSLFISSWRRVEMSMALRR